MFYKIKRWLNLTLTIEQEILSIESELGSEFYLHQFCVLVYKPQSTLNIKKRKDTTIGKIGTREMLFYNTHLVLYHHTVIY